MATTNLTPFYITFPIPEPEGSSSLVEPDTFVIELHATEQITVQETNKTSDSPVRSGRTISDDLIKNPTKIGFKGTTSNYATARNGVSPSKDTQAQIIKLLKRLSIEKTLFTVVFDDPHSPDAKESYSNCVLTSFGRRRSATNSNGWDVDLQFKQLDLLDQLTIGQINVLLEVASKDFQNTSEPKTDFRDAQTYGGTGSDAGLFLDIGVALFDIAFGDEEVN